MLTLSGSPHNINSPLIGKVSFSPVKKKNRSVTVCVTSKLSQRGLDEYLAVISKAAKTNESKSHEIPIAFNAEGLNLLSDGDVVELLPNGLIHVLYQIKSKDNIIFVTSKCNANCIMCPQPIDYNEESLLESDLRLISLMDSSTEELALTGGEPTLVGDDLFRLILACKHFLPYTSLLLLTNGIRFSDYRYTRFFSSLDHPSLTVAISLYADNSVEHDFIVGSKGAFNKILIGILNLASFGNPIEIRTVIHKYTCDKLLRLSEFIYRNMTFVKHIAFMGLEPIARARANLESLWVEPKEFVRPLEEATHFLVQRGMKVSIYNVPLCLLPERLWNYARQSISDWKKSFCSRCAICGEEERCSGMFSSGVELYEDYLRPMKRLPPK